jgi:hypothetical protein
MFSLKFQVLGQVTCILMLALSRYGHGLQEPQASRAARAGGQGAQVRGDSEGSGTIDAQEKVSIRRLHNSDVGLVRDTSSLRLPVGPSRLRVHGRTRNRSTLPPSTLNL